MDPARIGYVEAHGTATALGDPIEVDALSTVFGRAGAAAGGCALGSVKSNIGHTEAASGLVGLLKGLHVLESGRIPATLHTETPNPAIPFDRHGLVLAATPMALRGQAVAVNSFGFGGTNASLVLGKVR